jgi:predicted DNA-binding transcriptional regulator YafY
MANIKHKAVRYSILDSFFISKSYKIDELLTKLNEKLSKDFRDGQIGKEQLKRDISTFRTKFNAPLEYNPSNKTYKYSDSKFSISQMPYLKDEYQTIVEAQKLLERKQNDPRLNKIAEALFELEEGIQEKEGSKVVYYDHYDNYTGLKHLKPFRLFIKNKQVLEVEYKDFKKKESIKFEFHPYVLKQYNRRWFVYGYRKECDLNGNAINEYTWSIPFDERLINYTVNYDKNYVKSETNWDAFFDTLVGVSKTGEVTQVKLRFHNGGENFFKTKPFHPDPETDPENDKEYLFWTSINYELQQQILAYGKEIEVIKPPELVEAIKKQLSTMNKYYNL